MTIGFVRASKAYILPSVLGDVFRFRKAFLTLNSVLRSMYAALTSTSGETAALSTLRGDYIEASIDCHGYRPSGHSTVCPWGLLSFIQNAAAAAGVNGTLSEVEVRSPISRLHEEHSRRRRKPASSPPDEQ